MRVNIENAAANCDPESKPWLLDELVRNLKEMRDRSNAGDMASAVAEFFEVFRFNDNQTNPAPIRAVPVPRQGSNGCTRSHPHENMDPECVQKTEVARLANKLAALTGGREPRSKLYVEGWNAAVDEFRGPYTDDDDTSHLMGG